MQIDIIMPFNKGIHFLKDAVKSLEKSEIDANLILVLDNAVLEDEIKDIINTKNLTVKVIEQTGRQNVSTLRNEGLINASGEYVYFMDSDDYVMPDTFEKLRKKAEETQADVVFGDICETYYKYDTTAADYPDKIAKKTEFELRDRLVSSDFSVLNMLIKREIIKEIRFDESNDLYPDITYMAKLISMKPHFEAEKDAVYMKRIHNDSIRYPALNQINAAGRKELHELAYEKAREISKSSEVSKVISLIKTKNEQVLKEKRKTQIKNFFKRPTFIYRMIEKYLIRRLPMKKNWIVFESFLGKNYSDSCKYIYEYLQKNEGSRYKYIWVINDKKTDIPGKVTKVKYLGLRWFYYTSRAKYYVNNMRQPLWMNKREGSIMLETWHGTPLKKLVFDMDDIHAATPTYKMDVYKQSRKWDYLISDNPYSTHIFESCFLYPREKIIETGYPRNDILYDTDRIKKAIYIKRKLGVPEDKKVILYAPTWRDDEYYRPGEYKFALKLNLEKLKKELGEKYVILLRTHYFIADAIDTGGLEGFAFNVSRYDDIAKLYTISDVCITDYSSVFFDYANIRKPILFYVYDFDKYKDRLRGFYIDMEKELPGPLLYSEDEVIDALKNIDKIEAEYRQRYDEFYERFCCIDDGLASKRVCDIVFK